MPKYPPFHPSSDRHDEERIRISILRAGNGDFIAAEPASGGHPSEDAFLTNSVASAGDCTGIAVTPPLDEAQTEALQDIAAHPADPAGADTLRANKDLASPPKGGAER